MKLVSLGVIVTLIAFTVQARMNPPMPYGPVNDADLEHLQEFAQKSGFNLKESIARIYSRGKKIDEEALARFFRFSLSLNGFDKKARAYGHLLLSSFLYLGEGYGVASYAQILDRQPANVQQRIRDFLFYPSSMLPIQERDQAIAELNRAYPTIFPIHFQFAQGDPLFVARDYPAVFAFTITQDAKTRDLIVSIENISKAKQQVYNPLVPPVPQFSLQNACLGEVSHHSQRS